MRVSGNLVVIGAIEYAGRICKKHQKLPPKLPPNVFDTPGRFVRSFFVFQSSLRVVKRMGEAATVPGALRKSPRSTVQGTATGGDLFKRVSRYARCLASLPRSELDGRTDTGNGAIVGQDCA